MNVYIANAFSLQMLSSFPANVSIAEVSDDEFNSVKSDAISAVGHADTANILGVACQRINVSLSKGDILYVAQVIGGRLPEGTTTLPEGFKLKFLKVTI